MYVLFIYIGSILGYQLYYFAYEWEMCWDVEFEGWAWETLPLFSFDKSFWEAKRLY